MRKYTKNKCRLLIFRRVTGILAVFKTLIIVMLLVH
jgi:hypothetical protein